MQSLISISDLTKMEIMNILNLSQSYKEGLTKKVLLDKVIASCFFENSTRTKLSFDSAIARLGGKTIGFANSDAISLASKGESLVDTLKVIAGYVDALIIRHPQDGAARLASEICNIPVINAGDGANQHPTQTLLDLFSILDCQGYLEGVNLGIMGDLKYSRTVHSLVYAASLFNMKLYFISPKSLRIDDEYLFMLKKMAVSYSFHLTIEEVMGKLDCLYITRLQKERFLGVTENSKHDNYYGITMESLVNAKSNFRILHPLPRLDELPVEIDDTPYAYYFQQAQNGVYTRQALLDILIGQ